MSSGFLRSKVAANRAFKRISTVQLPGSTPRKSEEPGDREIPRVYQVSTLHAHGSARHGVPRREHASDRRRVHPSLRSTSFLAIGRDLVAPARRGPDVRTDPPTSKRFRSLPSTADGTLTCPRVPVDPERSRRGGRCGLHARKCVIDCAFIRSTIGNRWCLIEMRLFWPSAFMAGYHVWPLGGGTRRLVRPAARCRGHEERQHRILDLSRRRPTSVSSGRNDHARIHVPQVRRFAIQLRALSRPGRR
jgi:hypothetical protein